MTLKQACSSEYQGAQGAPNNHEHEDRNSLLNSKDELREGDDMIGRRLAQGRVAKHHTTGDVRCVAIGILTIALVGLRCLKYNGN